MHVGGCPDDPAWHHAALLLPVPRPLQPDRGLRRMDRLRCNPVHAEDVDEPEPGPAPVRRLEVAHSPAVEWLDPYPNTPGHPPRPGCRAPERARPSLALPPRPLLPRSL